jgi:hypothetical protein
MTDTTAQDLAEKLVALLFPDDPIPPEDVPTVALAIVEHAPALQAATEAESQFIFYEICGALAARQVARVAVKTARWLA